MEQQLQHSDRPPGDLGSGEAAKVRHADLVGDLGLCQFSFGLPDGANLGAGVDSCGDNTDKGAVGFAFDDVHPGIPSRHVGRTGQRGEANDVAHGIDVGHTGLEVLVDVQLLSAVDRQPDGLQSEPVRVATATDRCQQDVRLDQLA